MRGWTENGDYSIRASEDAAYEHFYKTVERAMPMATFGQNKAA